MKYLRRVFTICILSMIIASTSASEASAMKINMVIDGTPVMFGGSSGMPFVDSSNRTQVPIRVAAETFGCYVEWNDFNKIVIVSKDGIVVQVPIGKSYIVKNGEIIANDTTAQIKDDRTYLPIRIVLEAFGATVSWDSKTSSVIVASNPTTLPSEIAPMLEPRPEIQQPEPSQNAYQEEVLRHQSAINEIESKYENFKRFVENRINEIRRETTPYYGSATDFNRDLAAKQKEIATTEAKLFAIRLDDTASANAKRLVLEEQLMELQDELQLLEARGLAQALIDGLKEQFNQREYEYYDAIREENALHQRNILNLRR